MCERQPSHDMSHATFTLHVYGLTLTMRGGGDGGGVTGEDGKPETAVQDCVSTFLRVKPLDI